MKDQRALRDTLGRYATGVALVTTRDGRGRSVGLTINSFASLSLSPPLILWSLDRRSTCLSAFRRAGHFAINILAADQTALSDRFARNGEDKFDAGVWSEGAGGVPVLKRALAVLECRTARRVAGGDHLLFIGEVLAHHHRVGRPLVYLAGRYATTARD